MESWPPTIFIPSSFYHVRYFSRARGQPAKEHTSQPLLWLVLALCLGSGQWDESKRNVCNYMFMVLKERNILISSPSSFFFPEGWSGSSFSYG